MESQSGHLANDGVNLVALTRDRIAELDRLRTMGLRVARSLSVAADGLPPEAAVKQIIGGKGVAVAFERTLRAIRQTVVLEFELRGLFKAPDRAAPRRLRLSKPAFDDLFDRPERETELDDTRTRSDYRTGPLDAVVAGIRKTLGAEPPPNDPFAPAAARMPAPRAAAPVIAPKLPRRPKIAARIQPPRRPQSAEPASAQAEPAHKAATLAIKALGGKGFRVPAKSKNRSNRGPPK